MSEDPQVSKSNDLQPPRPRAGRRGVRLLVVLLACVLLGAGGILWAIVRNRPGIPTPPEGPADLEAAVRAAVQEARAGVLKEPRSAQAWGKLADTFMANDLDDEGMACAAVAERLDPRNPRWPYYQGGALTARGDREPALPHLRRAADLADASGEGQDVPRVLLAETLLGLGQLDEAEAELQKVLSRQPDEVRVHFDLGLLAVSRQQWDKARGHLRRCLDSESTRHKARLQLAAICLRQGDQAGARSLRAEADRLPADRGWNDPFVREYQSRAIRKKSRFQHAEELEARGRFVESAQVLRQLTEAYPDDDLPYLMLGKALTQAGQYAEAERALRRALKLAPEKVQAHHYLSLLMFNAAEAAERRGVEGKAHARDLYAQAATEARAALARKPDYGVAHLTLGLALARLGKKEEAVTALREAVRCTPEHGELHFRLGEMLAETGRTEEARARLKRALELAPPGAGWAQAARARLDKIDR
jgi:tetratricopeptide (TPR) repeat protein